MVNEFPKTIQEADPSKFSHLEGERTLRLEPVELKGHRFIRDIFVDKETGERFYKISHRPESQRLLALILKGVINVSDIVKVGNEYYSHEQDFNNIKPSNEDIAAEATADLFIITQIFGDYDHEYYHSDSAQKLLQTTEDQSNVVEHHNLRVDKANSRLNFYDFGKPWVFIISELGRPQFTTEMFEQQRLEMYSWTSTTLSILRKKSEILLGLFQKDEFGRFKKILEKSGYELSEEKQKSLFDEIKARLENINEVLSELEFTT